MVQDVVSHGGREMPKEWLEYETLCVLIDQNGLAPDLMYGVDISTHLYMCAEPHLRQLEIPRIPL
jgi:hypothetical protein